MLSEFLRRSRILPQILNSAAIFNNLLVTFTFIFTYSLALQLCDRHVLSSIYCLLPHPFPFISRRSFSTSCNHCCLELPILLLPGLLPELFLYSFPRPVLTLSYIQLFCVFLYPLQYPNLYTLIAVSNHFLFCTFRAPPLVLISSLRFSSLMCSILPHLSLSRTIFHFHVPHLVPQLLSVLHSVLYYYYYCYYILLYLTRFSPFWAIIGEKLNTRENMYRRVETCR